MKKKTLLTTVLAGALAFGCFAAVGCGGNDNKANTEKNDGVFALNSQEEVYAYSAASAASLVGNLGVSQTNGGTSYLSDVTINDQSKYIDIINDYISLAANMLDTNGGFTITEKVSDNGDFEYKMEIQCNGVFGESSEYTMYYNKTISSVEQEDGETEIEFNVCFLIIAFIASDDDRIAVLGFLYRFNNEIVAVAGNERKFFRKLSVLLFYRKGFHRAIQLISKLNRSALPVISRVREQCIGKAVFALVGVGIGISRALEE